MYTKVNEKFKITVNAFGREAVCSLLRRHELFHSLCWTESISLSFAWQKWFWSTKKNHV